MLQRVTFIGCLDVDTDGLNWESSMDVVMEALLEGDGYNSDKTPARLLRITGLEIIEGES